jgi:hypothetical protein
MHTMKPETIARRAAQRVAETQQRRAALVQRLTEKVAEYGETSIWAEMLAEATAKFVGRWSSERVAQNVAADWRRKGYGTEVRVVDGRFEVWITPQPRTAAVKTSRGRTLAEVNAQPRKIDAAYLAEKLAMADADVETFAPEGGRS